MLIKLIPPKLDLYHTRTWYCRTIDNWMWISQWQPGFRIHAAFYYFCQSFNALGSVGCTFNLYKLNMSLDLFEDWINERVQYLFQASGDTLVLTSLKKNQRKGSRMTESETNKSASRHYPNIYLYSTSVLYLHSTVEYA